MVRALPATTSATCPRRCSATASSRWASPRGPTRASRTRTPGCRPRRRSIYVENIRDALAGIDPANAEVYAANAADYVAEIRAVAEPIRAELAAIPEERRWLATSEGAFSYLARDFGLNELFIWPINADQQGSPQQVRRVIDAMREHAVPAIFSESTIPPDAAKQVARETGARYGGVL